MPTRVILSLSLGLIIDLTSQDKEFHEMRIRKKSLELFSGI
jgi:hypothetical protein